jgi:hypothetical protein
VARSDLLFRLLEHLGHDLDDRRHRRPAGEPLRGRMLLAAGRRVHKGLHLLDPRGTAEEELADYIESEALGLARNSGQFLVYEVK